MAGAAVKAGMPLEAFLRREGWGEDEIADVLATKAAARADVMEAMATGRTTVAMPGQPPRPQPPQPGIASTVPTAADDETR